MSLKSQLQQLLAETGEIIDDPQYRLILLEEDNKRLMALLSQLIEAIPTKSATAKTSAYDEACQFLQDRSWMNV